MSISLWHRFRQVLVSGTAKFAPALGTDCRRKIFIALVFAPLVFPTPVQLETEIQRKIRLEVQESEYEQITKKSIVELQQFRTSESIELKSGETVTLTDLNPKINTWFLLKFTSKNGTKSKTYHIENVDPQNQTLKLAAEPAIHLAIDGGRSPFRCVPWRGSSTPLERAEQAQLPFSPFCGGRLYLHNKIKGTRTTLEATSEFLRDNVWLGENLVGFVKDNFFKDSEFESSEEVAAEKTGIEPIGLKKAQLDRSPVVRSYFGLDLTCPPEVPSH